MAMPPRLSVAVLGIVLLTFVLQVVASAENDGSAEQDGATEHVGPAEHIDSSGCSGDTCKNGGECDEFGQATCKCKNTCFKGPTCGEYNNLHAPTFSTKGGSPLKFYKNVKEASLPPASDNDQCDRAKTGATCPCIDYVYKILWSHKETSAPEDLFTVTGNDMVGTLTHTPHLAKKSVLSRAYSSLIGEDASDESYTLVVEVKNRDVDGEGGEAEGAEVSTVTLDIKMFASILELSDQKEENAKMLEMAETLLSKEMKEKEYASLSRSGPSYLRTKRTAEEMAAEEVHSIKKRSTGVGYADQYTFDLSLTGASSSATTFDLGETIYFKILIHASNAATMQLKVELLSERFWRPVFSFTNFRLTDIGANILDFTGQEVVNYEYRDTTDSFDRAIIDLGEITNKRVANVAAEFNQITLEFEAVVMNTQFLVKDSEYWISAGAEYFNGSKIWVSQKKLAFAGVAVATTGQTPTFGLTGASQIGLGQASAYELTINAVDMFNDLVVDVYAPVNASGIMSVCKMAVTANGKHYDWRHFETVPANFTTTADSEGTNSHGRLNLGSLFNQGHAVTGGTAADNNIKVTIIVRLEDTTLVTADEEIWMGVSVTVGTTLIWTEQTKITVVATENTTMSETPSFVLQTTTPEVQVGAAAGFILNMTLPAGSEEVYELQISTPFNDSVARMSIDHISISYLGFNIPCLLATNLTETKEDGENVAYATYNLGRISNVGGKTGADDSVIQFVIGATVVNSTGMTMAGDKYALTIGMKFGTYYYVAVSSDVTVLPEATIYTGEEISFVIENKMTSNEIFAWGTAVYYVDMYFAPGTVHGPISAAVRVEPLDNLPVLNLIDASIIHRGSGLVILGNLSASLVTTDNDTTADGSLIYTDAVLNLDHITNALDSDLGQDKLKYSRSTLRLRIAVQARSKHHDLMASSPNLTIFASIDYSTSQLWAAVATLVYNASTPDFFSEVGSPQPAVVVNIAEGYTPLLWGGQIARFTLDHMVPSRTVSDYVVEAVTTNDSLSICLLEYKSRSKNIIVSENFGELLNEQEQGSWANSSRIYETSMPAEGVSNINAEPWSSEMESDGENRVRYEVVVHLRDIPGLVAQDYTFLAMVKVGTSYFYYEHGTITADPSYAVSSPDIMPDVLMDADGATEIGYGGGLAITIELYVPANSAGSYTIDIFAPGNFTKIGSMGIVDSGFINQGANLACSSYLDYSYTRESSGMSNDTANDNVTDHGIISVGFVPNAIVTGETQIPANMLRFRSYIKTNTESDNFVIGDLVYIAATLTLGDRIWVASYGLEVVQHIPDTQLMGVPEVEMKDPEFPVTPLDGNIMNHHMGSTETYRLFINTTQGSSVLKLIIEVPVIDDEPIMSLANLRFLKAGVNVVGSLDPAKLTNQTEAMGDKETKLELDFGVIYNTGYTQEVTVDGVEWTDLDGMIELSLDITLLDHLANVHGVPSNITYRFTHSDTGGSVVMENKTFSIIPLMYSDDNAVFDWQMWMVGKTVENGTSDDSIVYLASDTIEIHISVSHSNSSARRATDATIYCRVPFYSAYGEAYNYTGKAPTTVTSTERAVEIHFDELRLDEYSEISFNVTIDPYGYLPKGLRYETLTIPADIVHYRLNKTHAPEADQWFTQIETISFSVYIPECLEPLGMEAENISDCQITASSSLTEPVTGQTPAHESRLNIGKGWGPAPRGPPFLGKEYIQVDMGSQVKFTGIAVQPPDLSTITYIQTFTLQYSMEGIRWFDVESSTDVTKVFSVDFTWDDRNVSKTDVVFVPLGNETFTGRYIRILPQANVDNTYYHKLRFELYGCPYPYGRALPTYSCLSQPTPLFYLNDRQMAYDSARGRLIACMLSHIGGSVKCSYTFDKGTSWFQIDEFVGNIMFMDTSTGTYYAGSANGLSYMKSDDGGDIWFHIETSEYETAEAASTRVFPKTIPYELASFNSTDLVQNYAFADGTDVFAASEKGIHYWADSSLANTAKTTADGLIAYWGTSEWKAVN